MRPRSLIPACALISLPGLPLLGGGVRADVFSIPAAPPGPPPALAVALAALAPPKQDLFLTVGADKLFLPPGAAPAGPDDRPGQVGEAYGLVARDFGGVTALAPPTMAVLNTRPSQVPPAQEALKLLLAGLTPPQWAALTGEAGLGLADLGDETQRGLFAATLPSGDVTVTPQPTGGPLPAPVKMTVSDLASARLRLGRRTQIDLPVEGKPNTGMGLAPTSIAGRALYTASSFGSPPAQDPADGAAPRETRPNNPKDADLDYSAPALKQSVSVAGLETVGDLVARVGGAAGFELYADRRYEKRRVTLIGRRTARAVDLLRATAFCLTGTFRRVGPAYVLTADREGTATRRQRLTRLVQQADMDRHAALDAAGDALLTVRGGLGALPPLDDLDLSGAQKALLPPEPSGAGSPVRVPFAQLTRAQQESAAAQVRQENEAVDRAEQSGGGHGDRLTLTGQFTLESEPFLFMQSPAVPGPVQLNAVNAHSFSLYQASGDLMRKWERERMGKVARTPASLVTPSPAPLPLPPPSLKAALAPYMRRAVLASPRTAAEVDGAVASMKVLGLNQLWLDVFSEGHSHLDTGILAEALARTRGTGILVVPALDLLRWGKDAPEAARDLTALGETSIQHQAWEQHVSSVMQGLPPGNDSTVLPVLWACPAAPAVETTLEALVRRLAATPGVGALAVWGAVPPGYEHPPGDMASGGGLGYVPALRLSLLRRDHVDPVDLDTDFQAARALNLAEDWEAATQARSDWGALRDGASRDLLRRLLAAGQAAKQEAGGGGFRFLVERRPSRGDSGQDWYGLWEDPQAPLPEVPVFPPLPGPWHPPPDRDDAAVAHARSRVALDALPAWYTNSPYIIADMLRRLKPGWDGLVLDATGAEGLARLARLAGKK